MEPLSTLSIDWSRIRQAVGPEYRQFTFTDTWQQATAEQLAEMAALCRAWDGPTYWGPSPARLAQVIDDQLAGVRYEYRNIGLPGHPELRMVAIR